MPALLVLDVLIFLVHFGSFVLPVARFLFPMMWPKYIVCIYRITGIFTATHMHLAVDSPVGISAPSVHSEIIAHLA